MEWENAFEPLRDFFRRRKALARFRQLPVITVQGRPNYYRANTSPSPDWDVRIINEAKEQVGTACYALTPLNDQLWLYFFNEHLHSITSTRRNRYSSTSALINKDGFIACLQRRRELIKQQRIMLRFTAVTARNNTNANSALV